MIEQIVGLKNKARMVLPECSQLVLVHARNDLSADLHASARRFFEPGQLIEQRALTRAGWSENTADLAGKNIKIDIFQGSHFFFSHVVYFIETACLDYFFSFLFHNLDSFFLL